MRLLRPVVLVVGLLMLLAPALAEARRKGGAGDGSGKRAKVMERVRAVRAARIVEVLDLDEAGAGRLFTVLGKYDDLILPLKVEVGQARREIKQLIDSGKWDDAAAGKLIERILAARAQIARLEEQRSAEVRKVLTTRQFAILVVELPEIERDIERQIRKAAGRRGGD